MDNMEPFDGKQKKELTVSAIDTARKFLRYAFDEINYTYDNLTLEERRMCTEQEFDNMVKAFRLQ